MKSLLLLSFALLGLGCASPTSRQSVNLQPLQPNIAHHSQEADPFSGGQVFEEPKPTPEPAFAIPRRLQDDPKPIRDYQQKWETHLNSSQFTPTPVFNPTKVELLRAN